MTIHLFVGGPLDGLRREVPRTKFVSVISESKGQVTYTLRRLLGDPRKTHGRMVYDYWDVYAQETCSAKYALAAVKNAQMPPTGRRSFKRSVVTECDEKCAA